MSAEWGWDVAGKDVVKIWGTQPENINEAEDRDLWYNILKKLDIKQPPGTMVTSEAQALTAAKELGYPVMVRPSFVLGGRAMEIVYRSGLLCSFPSILELLALKILRDSQVCQARVMNVFLRPKTAFVGAPSVVRPARLRGQ